MSEKQIESKIESLEISLARFLIARNSINMFLKDMKEEHKKRLRKNPLLNVKKWLKLSY